MTGPASASAACKRLSAPWYCPSAAGSALTGLVRAVRPPQWVKNVLVFAASLREKSLNDRLATYIIPTALDAPTIRTI